MKKTLLLLAAAIVAVSPLVAGNGDTAAKGNISAEIPAYAPAAKSDNKETKAKKGPWDRKKYINLGYIKQSLSPEFGNAFESKFGASFSSGRNIYLHKKPIANILKFAIDFGSEVNYAQYKDLIGDYDYSDNDFGYTDESDNNYDLGYEDEEEEYGSWIAPYRRRSAHRPLDLDQSRIASQDSRLLPLRAVVFDAHPQRGVLSGIHPAILLRR